MGPILGYAGAMDWLDTALVAETARAWPESQIVLLGPAYEREWWKKQEAINSLPNVHYFGKIEYSELPAWVQRFDLALMPLLSSRLKGGISSKQTLRIYRGWGACAFDELLQRG